VEAGTWQVEHVRMPGHERAPQPHQPR
jgi:hypothetical protein